MKQAEVIHPAEGATVPKLALSSRPGWRRPLVVFLIILASLVILVPAGVAIANRASFGRFAFWALPSRVDFCGRRYYEQGSESGSPSNFLAADKGTVWKQVASTFTGRPIYAVVDMDVKPGSVCTMGLYIHSGGHDQWIVYPLSGGP